MGPAAKRFAVLLAKPGSLDLARIAEVLAGFHAVPIQDAARAARACWGIVAEGLEEARALELARRLDDAKLGGWAVPESALAELPQPRSLLKAECSASALILPCSAGAGRVPPRAIRLIAAGAFAEGPSGEGGDPLSYCLDIVLDEPRTRLRVDARDFDYSYLGRRMRLSAAGNFKLLVWDLCRLAPKALRSRGTKALILDGRAGGSRYASLADLEREARWLLTIS